MDSPSQAAAPRPAGIVNCRIGSARWRLASRIAHAATASAAGQATLRGRSEAINESGASSASDHNIVPSQLSVFPELADDAAGYFRYNGTRHIDAAFNPTHKALLPIFPGLTEDQRKRFIFGNIPPTLSLVVMNDQITYMILHAVSANEVAMTRGWLVAPGAMQTPLFYEKLRVGQESIKGIVAQDLHVDELIPTGLRSRFAVRGRYSWQERAQRDFNHWLVKRYQRAWQAQRATAAE